MTIRGFSRICENAGIDILIWVPECDEDVYCGAIDETPAEYATREIETFLISYCDALVTQVTFYLK